jgi:hypothetical protein
MSSLKNHKVRYVFVVVVIAFIGIFGYYDLRILSAPSPNFKVSGPSSLSGQSSCSNTYSGMYCQTITIPFQITVTPIAGYKGTVMVFTIDMESSSYSVSCSPSSIPLSGEASTSCQIITAGIPGSSWNTHMRATDGSITHDISIPVTVT